MIINEEISMQIIMSLLNNPDVRAFLISLGAGISWDAIKAGSIHLKKADETSFEEQLLIVLEATMNSFYEYKGYDYCETKVMSLFLSAYQDIGCHTIISSSLRNMLEYTTENPISDSDFDYWVSLFTNEIAKNETIFKRIILNNQLNTQLIINRDLYLTRVREELIVNCENNPLTYDVPEDEYKEVILNLNKAFSTSWKDEILAIFNKIPISSMSLAEKRLRDFIHSTEKCEAVCDAFKKLLSIYKQEKDILPHYISKLRSLIYEPQFNKAFILSGTTGSGKTAFIFNYIQRCIDALEQDIPTTIPFIIHFDSFDSTAQIMNSILTELSFFFDRSFADFRDCSVFLEALDCKVCIIIENLDIYLKQSNSFLTITDVTRDLSRFDQFRFLFTINEYSCYFLESDPAFQKKYCIKNKYLQRNYSDNFLYETVFSMETYNQNSNVISHILKDIYNLSFPYDMDYIRSITTPLEAHYFGECSSSLELITYPSTYYEFVKKIVDWKDMQLESKISSIEADLLTIISQALNSRNYIFNELAVSQSTLTLLASVQLLSRTIHESKNIFLINRSKEQVSYHLRVYAYWAAKITYYHNQDITNDIKTILDFPFDFSEWLIPCYIFYNYEQSTEYDELFTALDDHALLAYALFCAYKAPIAFSESLYQYMIKETVQITSVQECYSVLYFVRYSALKMSKKLTLLSKISDQIYEYKLDSSYQKVFLDIIYMSSSPKKLKKNILPIAYCKNESINHFNGYNTAYVYMKLSSKQYKTITTHSQDILSYIYAHNDLKEQIGRDGNNTSFMDFFIRGIFERYLWETSSTLSDIYTSMESLFLLDYPYGSYIKRNLTCAAGNLFSSSSISNEYYYQYYELIKHFLNSSTLYDKETAWFLIRNSINEEHPLLSESFFPLLEQLYADDSIKEKYEEEIDKLLSQKNYDE